jgi:hypothetical protein
MSEIDILLFPMPPAQGCRGKLPQPSGRCGSAILPASVIKVFVRSLDLIMCKCRRSRIAFVELTSAAARYMVTQQSATAHSDPLQGYHAQQSDLTASYLDVIH